LFFFLSKSLVSSRLTDQNQEKRQNKTHIFGIITSIDLLEFIVKNDKSNESIKQNGFHQEAKSLSIIAKQSEALH
jgi:hypothetical protein